MVSERPSVEKAVHRIAQGLGYKIQQSRHEHAGRKLFLTYLSAGGNYVDRSRSAKCLFAQGTILGHCGAIPRPYRSGARIHGQSSSRRACSRNSLSRPFRNRESTSSSPSPFVEGGERKDLRRTKRAWARTVEETSDHGLESSHFHLDSGNPCCGGSKGTSKKNISGLDSG
jgi:hypothetical protein